MQKPKDGSEKTERLHVAVSEEAKKRIEEDALQHGYRSVSAYVRDKLLGEGEKIAA
jgi:hypothetical protein